MKNKILSIILAICFVIPAMFIFSACGEKEEVKTYEITIINGVEGGTILPVIENGTKSVQVCERGDYTVIIQPDEGYKVVGLLINGVIQEKDEEESIIYTFENISSNQSIAAQFEIVDQEIDIDVPEKEINELKIEGIIINYAGTADEELCDIDKLSITQYYSNELGEYSFIYPEENFVLITGNLSLDLYAYNSYSTNTSYSKHKFSNEQVLNNIKFNNNQFQLKIVCDNGVRGNSNMGYIDKYITIQVDELKVIELPNFENLYSYTIVSNNYITSIELIFSAVN